MMLRIGASRLLVVLALSAPASAQPPDGRIIAGGWSETTLSAEVKLAAAQAVKVIAIKRPRARLARINGAEMQVVAGLNYRLDLSLSDRSRWQAVVWKKLDKTMEVTALKPITGKP